MRAWNEFVARLGDVVPVPLLGLLLLLAAGLAALLWYWWPEWFRALGRIRLPRLRWPRWRSPRWWWPKLRWRRRRRRRSESAGEPVEPLDLPADELPEVPAGVLALGADELAAQGRYKEAVRERLRAIVRDLVERRVIEHHPGWTVTELATAAGHARPPCAAPLAAASEVFSRIWYGQFPATAADDAAMRRYAEQVRAALETRVAEGRVPA